MNEIEDLDDSWIKEFEQSDKDYKNYYKEDVTFIRLNCIYINNQNIIEKIKEEVYFFKQNNFLSRDEVLTIIKRNNIENDVHYNLLSILKYNITIEPIYLKNYLKNNNFSPNYLTSIKNIDSIYFQPTISLFHDINNLYIIFYEKTLQSHSITKKIYIKNTNSNFKKTKTKTKTKTLRNTFKKEII